MRPSEGNKHGLHQHLSGQIHSNAWQKNYFVFTCSATLNPPDASKKAQNGTHACQSARLRG